MSETMTPVGKYLYCIIRSSGERTFEDIAPIGNASGQVHTVCSDGLAAVVSDTAGTEYETSRANMVAHERVQEWVMREFTLLPVRFSTITHSESPADDVRRLLGKRFKEFDKLLADMEGKVELGLKASWRDEKAIFDEIVAENPDIRRLRDALASKPPEVMRFEGVHLGELVKAALERKKSKEAATALAALRRLATGVHENAIIVDRMLVNAAFLVDEGRQGEFDREVSKLDEELGQRVVFKYVGPIPPWNFVEVVVNWDEIRD